MRHMRTCMPNECFHLAATFCPCCHSTCHWTARILNQLQECMVQLPLQDVMVCCRSCDRSNITIKYDSHCCTDVTRQEMQLASKVVHKMLDASKENFIHVDTALLELKVNKSE